MRVSIRSPLAFVLMPFDSAFDKVYERGIRRACDEAGILCVRVDEQRFRENIVERLYGEIERADLIIADMSGHNPNVFYEAGYARALKKPTIYLSREGEIPFDLKQYRHIVYGDDLAKLRERLKQEIVSTLGESALGDVTLPWAHVRLISRTGRCLDADLSEAGNGQRVQHWTFHGGENQLWLVESAGGGYFRVTSRLIEKSLSVSQNSNTKGTEVVLWEYHATPWQQWRFQSVDGAYRVVNRGSGKCLTIQHGGREDGMTAVQDDDRAARSQRWWMFLNVSA